MSTKRLTEQDHSDLSFRLAKTLGWKATDDIETLTVMQFAGGPCAKPSTCVWWKGKWKKFDYRRWKTIGPIMRDLGVRIRKVDNPISEYAGRWVVQLGAAEWILESLEEAIARTVIDWYGEH